MVLKKMMPALYESLGVFLPLITTNCAVLGVASNNASNYPDDFIMSMFYAVGTAFGKQSRTASSFSSTGTLNFSAAIPRSSPTKRPVAAIITAARITVCFMLLVLHLVSLLQLY